MAISSTYMLLPIPTVGVSDGPEWATNINNCLDIIDTHDHSAGKGVQITPAGISINTDLPYGSNNATQLRTVRFSAQSAALALSTDLTCLYAVNDDLYYNDGQGNHVRITQSGSVAGSSGTITGLPSGTASASYNTGTGTFVFQSATNTAADLDGRSLKLRKSTVSSYALTLSPPNSLASDYTITLPALPGSTKILTIDNSGNMAASYGVDGSTIVVSSNILKVPDGGIGPAQLATDSVIASKILASNVTAAKIESSVNLPGNNVQVNNYGVLACAGSSVGMAFLRAAMNADGTLVFNEGFASSSKTGTGTYSLSFTTAFASAPIVVGSVTSGAAIQAVVIQTATTTGVTYKTIGTGGEADAPADLIIIGPR